MVTRRSNPGALVGGVILILIGLMALVGQWVGGAFWGDFWPVIIIAIGLLFFAGAFVGGGSVDALGIPAKDAAALAIPGSIITVVGLMLWLQQIFDYAQSWAYGWTVIIMAVGFGLFVMGWRLADARRRAEGVRVMKTGFVLFLVFGAFFEMVFRSFNGAQYLFPAALIVLGLYLLVTRAGLFRSARPVTPEDEKKSA